jgi:ketosteroid isomerase-like protein
MSQQNPEVVRQSLELAADSHRRLDERLALRVPYIRVLVARTWWKRPPRSRLRQAILLRVVRLGFEAANRGDYEAAFGFYDRDVEFIPPASLIGLGDESSYRGPEARIEYEKNWRAEWGDFRYGPEELRDLGDRLLLIGRISSSGLSSGAAIDTDFANLFTISAGLVIREQVFFSHAEALEAAGLSD